MKIVSTEIAIYRLLKRESKNEASAAELNARSRWSAQCQARQLGAIRLQLLVRARLFCSVRSSDAIKQPVVRGRLLRLCAALSHIDARERSRVRARFFVVAIFCCCFS